VKELVCRGPNPIPHRVNRFSEILAIFSRKVSNNSHALRGKTNHERIGQHIVLSYKNVFLILCFPLLYVAIKISKGIIMTEINDRIIEEALALPEDIRLNLIEKLLKSLNLPIDEDIDQLWAKEAERRVATD
jgi:hypothetical protein